MNFKTIQRHYDKLEPLERFRLALAADARGDDAEMRALRDSTPLKNYRMTQWEYYRMYPALLTITLIVSVDVLGNGGLLAWGHARLIDGSREVGEAETLSDMATLARRVIAAWDGFRVFVGGLQLDYATIEDRFFDPVALLRIDFVLRIAGFFAVSDDAQRDTAARDYADALRQVWDMELS